MQDYIEVSMEITSILKTYTDLVEPYSIDEQFMDVTNSPTAIWFSSRDCQKGSNTNLESVRGKS